MRFDRLRRGWASFVLAGALACGSGTALAQEADQEFRNGVAAFEEGRFEEAENHFRNVLKSKPDHEQALRYRDEAGYRFWVRVLARGGKLATVAQRILKAAEEQAVRDRQDLAELRTEMQGLWADDFMTEIETTEKLIAKYGHYVVPELVSVLKDRREDDKRVRAISLLARLGDEGTLAVIELLESDDITLQQNAAVCLGHMRDVRAIPALMRLKKKASDSHVQAAAQSAIDRIGGPSFDAPDYYARVAEEFYRENPLVMINRYREYVIWQWQEDRLAKRDVPRSRWNEEVAEEMAYDGLELAPDSLTLWALLVDIYAAEYCEIEETLRVAQQLRDGGGEVDEEELAKMTELQGKLAKVKMLVASRGAEGLLAGLGKAMADERAPVAVFLIERLQELNIDPAVLGGGGTAGMAAAPAAAPRPAQPAAQPRPTPAAQPANPPASNPPPAGPRPTRVAPDEPATPPADNPPADNPPPAGNDSPPPRRQPRRVSQAPGVAPQGDEPARLAYRGPIAQTAGGTIFGAAGETGQYTTGGAAFNAALTHGDKRVRYAAAIALAHLDPAGYANAGQVMTNLIDALGESGQRVVMVVERDQRVRNQIVGLLRELGYMTFGMDDGNQALVRARSFPAQDLILVSSELNPDGAGDDPIEIQFIDELKRDFRTRGTKVMILAPESRSSQMQPLVDEGKAIGVVSPEIDKANLADKVKQAFGSEADQRDEKSRSNAIATRAALAIASLRPLHTSIDIAQAAGPLGSNVKRDAGRPDDVRVACLKAIAAIGPAARGSCLEVCVNEFKDSSNSVEVRRALADAIGECLKGSSISPDAFEALKAGLAEEDEGVWRAAGYALGKAQLTGQQALDVFKAQRLE